MKNDNVIYDIIHELNVGEENKKSILEDLNNDPDYLDELIRFVCMIANDGCIAISC